MNWREKKIAESKVQELQIRLANLQKTRNKLVTSEQWPNVVGGWDLGNLPPKGYQDPFSRTKTPDGPSDKPTSNPGNQGSGSMHQAEVAKMFMNAYQQIAELDRRFEAMANFMQVELAKVMNSLNAAQTKVRSMAIIPASGPMSRHDVENYQQGPTKTQNPALQSQSQAPQAPQANFFDTTKPLV